MAGFSPTNRAMLPGARSLFGAPLFKVVIDQASLEATKKAVVDALKSESQALAIALARRSVEIISRLDAAAGHPKLALLWTHSAPKATAEGVSITVYSKAETMTFQTKSNAPGSTKTYPIEGKNLLDILLNGAKAHEICAKNPGVRTPLGWTGNPLRFEVAKGMKSSFFSGAAAGDYSIVPGGGKGPINFIGERPPAGLGIARFKNRDTDTVIAIDKVKHPGVVGSALLQIAAAEVERIADGEAAAAGRRIAAKVL
jgi:hypothetical protein